MKYFYVYVVVVDADHEHIEKVVYERKNALVLEKELEKHRKKDLGFFTYGDGLAEVKDFNITEITREEYEVLKRYL